MGTLVDSAVNSVDQASLQIGADILAKGMSKICHSLCCICFDTDMYVNYGTSAANSGITTGSLEELRVPFGIVAEKATDPADRDLAREFLDLDTLKDRLTENPVITLTCRAVDGKWSSAQFIVTESNPDGTPAKALYISEAVSIRKQEDLIGLIAARNGLLDSVTGVLNRTGYDLLLSEESPDAAPMAYALVDVDNFKDLNDGYGHAVGDAILSKVAEALRTITRKGDEVARIGGDEFAVILKDCPIGAAQQLIEKFECAHRTLSDALPDGKPVTLSVGVCFSPSGFSESIAEHADSAMYVIKDGGRGGCALSDAEGNVFQKWHDRDVSRRFEIAFANNVGSWRIEVPNDGSPRRMYCDEAMLRIAGEKRRVNSEELYRRWRSGLVSSDATSVDAALEALTQRGELGHTSFSWTNEDGDSFDFVSSVSRSTDFLDGRCYYGYFDVSRQGEGRKRENGTEMLNEALARSFVFGYVLDLETGTYITLRKPVLGPLSFLNSAGPTVSLRNALSRFAADDEGKKALRGMLDRKTLASRLAGVDHAYCDFLSTGVQSWCRAKIYSFKAGGLGGLEKVILVGESIEDEVAIHYEEPAFHGRHRTADHADRVLVVDDEELNREILREALSDDFEVVCVNDGVQAYETIQRQPDAFAGIVTDLLMPNMDGEGLLEKLEEDGISSEVPVVVITAENKIEAEKRCLSHGAVDFIRKPFHVPVTRQRVNNAVNLFKYQNHLRLEVERQTNELQSTCSELEEKSMWLREYAFRLSESSARMIEALGEIVEFRSVETGSHISRVKHYTHALAEKLMEMDPECGLTEESVQLITDASPLHDVGKIAIPDAVLLKPMKLTVDEFEVMKTHTTRGYELLASLDSAWDDRYRIICEEICLCHHERYDGKGYPNGLKGEEIPLSAQIVSIADIFDALSSDRVYRPAFTRAEAYRMIMDEEEGSFSERILKCFEATFSQLEDIALQTERGLE